MPIYAVFDRLGHHSTKQDQKSVPQIFTVQAYFPSKTESYLIVSFNRGHIAAGSNVISDFDMATYKGVIRYLLMTISF